ncbi:hypothetical protein FCI23_34820 [Actinacidiphila oryziradicis]|uniref:Uncharacterized protein n=1 Tax=Actinacidiphila oryziradicis TaxID=2571141 RepID=A0A4U0SBF5_9ACTN|nr:hypothetical protein [Actinacidiphila oryziradicis]TKA04751.1 hypothetical protein FCI23_34820 [Actinacidiphila oryziradicis]
MGDAVAPGANAEGEPKGTPYSPAVGAVSVDAKRNRVGRVMGRTETRVWLRPIGGGREWVAVLADLRPASDKESLSARVAGANARSRGEVL